MNKKLIGGLALAGAVFVSSTTASAEVTFDAATGTGFAGKGDVQLAFGWNNKQLQANASGLTFDSHQQSRYELTCEKVIETKKETKVLTQTRNRVSNLNSEIAYDARVRNQINGFVLTGAKASNEQVDADCGEWTQVGDAVLVSRTAHLSVTHGSSSVVIWTEPAV